MFMTEFSLNNWGAPTVSPPPSPPTHTHTHTHTTITTIFSEHVMCMWVLLSVLPVCQRYPGIESDIQQSFIH